MTKDEKITTTKMTKMNRMTKVTKLLNDKKEQKNELLREKFKVSFKFVINRNYQLYLNDKFAEINHGNKFEIVTMRNSLVQDKTQFYF